MNVTVLVFAAECYEHDELIASAVVPSQSLTAEGALEDSVLLKLLTYALSLRREWDSVKLVLQHDGQPVSEQSWYADPSSLESRQVSPEKELQLGLGRSMWLRCEVPITIRRLPL